MSQQPMSIAASLQPFVDNRSLAGAVTLVASKDRILSLEAVGWADIDARKPMQVDAMFLIASQTKPMTATALMMLVDEGKLHVEDPVESYLPEFADQWLAVEQDEAHVLLKKPARPITIRDVLAHTSGLPFRSPIEQPTLDLLPLEYRVRSYPMMPLQFEPGSRYQYSNAGTNTAGRIIEVVSGVSYERFMDERLLGPLGMAETTFWPDKAQLGRLAMLYKPGPEGAGLEMTTTALLRYPLDDRTRQPIPAGGLVSTATDVAKFCRMILARGMYQGRRYLSESSVNQMTSKQTGDLEESYGLGWAVGEGWCGHGGAFSTNMGIDWKRGLITIFLVQHEGFPGDAGPAINQAFQDAARTLTETA